jgi:hypothetical protein
MTTVERSQVQGPETLVPEMARGLLVGYGCDRTHGGYLILDEMQEECWTRRSLRVRGAHFSLRAEGARYCTGRCDLASGRSQPCPDRTALPDGGFEQCSPCRRATGFNPAFYFAQEISPQQEQRNREPHLVYLAHFGGDTLKVGMTHARRGIDRLLEQGARVGALLGRFPDAYRARALEEHVARSLDAAETVRAARKRHLLGSPFSAKQAREQLEAMIARIRLLEPELPLSPELVELDAYYAGPELFEHPYTDLSEAQPPAISGRCLGMIGDVLVFMQGGRRFLLSVGALVAQQVQLSATEQPNRVVGQQTLPF